MVRQLETTSVLIIHETFRKCREVRWVRVVRIFHHGKTVQIMLLGLSAGWTKNLLNILRFNFVKY